MDYVTQGEKQLNDGFGYKSTIRDNGNNFAIQNKIQKQANPGCALQT